MEHIYTFTLNVNTDCTLNTDDEQLLWAAVKARLNSFEVPLKDKLLRVRFDTLLEAQFTGVTKI